MVVRPFTDDDRQQLRNLHAQGKTLHATAQEMRRSKDTISRHAAELGLSWDRTQTAAATAAVVADGKARRAAMVVRLYGVAEKQLDRLERDEHTITDASFGKKITWTTTELPPDHIKALMQAIATATQAAVKLEQVDSGDTGTIGSLLGSLFDNLQAKHGTGDDA